MLKTPEGINVAVLPGGTWGTVWAKIAAEQNHHIWLHIRNQQDCETFNRTHSYPKRVPGVVFPETIVATSDPNEALDKVDVVVIASRSQDFRELIRGIRIRPKQKVVNLSKGIEANTNLRLSEVFEEEYPGTSHRYAVWSGFNLASRIATSKIEEGIVADADIASINPSVNLDIQELFGRGSIRLWPTDDVIGTELGGALKNIMTMAVGLGDGLGMGNDARKYVITQGLDEMADLGVFFGACRSTFSGYSGQGDLKGSVEFQSRNYLAGLRMAQGARFEELASSKQTYEGIYTIKPAFALAEKAQVEAPIIRMMYQIAHEGLDPGKGFKQLELELDSRSRA